MLPHHTSSVSPFLSEEEPAVQSMMPSPPKKSRKTFPKWSPGNASRKYPSDRTYPARPLLRVAEASLPHDASSCSMLKDRRVLGSVAGSPRSLAAPPQPASAFTPPPTFITMAMTGPAASQSEEDRAAPAARGNLGFWLCHLVLSDRVGWGFAEQPENLCLALGLYGLCLRATELRDGISWSFPPGRSPGGLSKGYCVVSALSGTSSVSWASSSPPASQKTT